MGFRVRFGLYVQEPWLRGDTREPERVSESVCGHDYHR